MSQTPEQYIESRKQATDDAHVLELWAKMEELYHKKLWHELTMTIKEVVEDGRFCQLEPLMSFHGQFLRHFENRMSRVHLATIALAIARRHGCVMESWEFLQHILKVVSRDTEAHVLCLTGMANLKARQRNEDGKCVSLPAVKALLDEANAMLAKVDGVTAAHTEYYNASALYYREIGDFTNYLEQALRYMSTVSMDQIKVEDRPELAMRLAIAALLSDQIFSFGYLLVHPIMEALKETKNEWLLDLLGAFNTGSIEKFESLRPLWSKQPDLSPRIALLEEKIRLLGLMSMAFLGPNQTRDLTFDAVAKRIGVANTEDVELLVIKALSKNLIHGHMDQVDQTIRITWVLPKIMSRDEIGGMARSFQMWRDHVKSVLRDIERYGKDLICQ